MNFRKANLDDIDDILRLERLGFGEHRFSRNALRNQLKSKSVDVLVAEDFKTIGFTKQYSNSKFSIVPSKVFRSEKCIGYVSVFYRSNSSKALIASITVDPAYRHKGIATKLMEKAIIYAYDRDITQIKLQVAKTNTNAIKINTKFDFKIEKTLSNYYGKGKSAYLMVKN